MATYKSGNRIVGTSAERATFVPSSPHWVELGRTTLSSTGDTIDVTGLTAKPYMMVLHHTLKSGGTGFEARMNFNDDSGSNYCVRHQSNGGSDSTRLNDPTIFFYRSNNGDPAYFGVGTINNIADQEKLGILHSVQSGTAGAGNAPSRREHAMKWANTSDQITSVKFSNTDASSDYAVGSEVVVLGYDPADTSGSSKWEELANVTATSGTTISSGTFTAKKYLMFDLYFNAQGSGGQPKLQVGNSTIDTGSNYATRRSSNGGADGTLTSDSILYPYSGGQNTSWYIKGFIINKSDEEKLFIMECSEQTTAGAGNVPTRCETVGKWANTSNQINIMQFTSHNSITISNAKLTIWGFD